MTMRCQACQFEIPEGHRFCGSCGSPVPSASQIPTVTGAAAVTPLAARLSSDTIAASFTPGVVVAGRYRVVGLIGRGGMGEVYRTDDLKLGQAVALKFLPRALASDPVRLERFLAEVRLARQIAHPNVCRVYDIAELDGQPFLSMEHIDGEDLGSLLQRIGRLSSDKALDIVRQIAAGLAAAHDRGVLHRDLKPSNVMLDGRGRARITDFGLAVASGQLPAGPDLSGTPAYMAPEQLGGEPASVRSDIYALGLVMYELYTGRRAYAGGSLLELIDRKLELPRAPSEVIADMDPAVERVMLRALAVDPRARPASVAQVVAALPGSSPLEALLRAGETPSPEMVAASGGREGLAPAAAWALLAMVVAGAVAAASLGSRGMLWGQIARDTPPAALAEIARQTLASLGHAGQPVDRASGFEVDPEQLRYVRARDPLRWRSARHDPSVVRFWYRESPRALEAWRYPFQYGNVSRVTPADPPLQIAGMALVRLDSRGRLTHLLVVPAAAGTGGRGAEPDWPSLLTSLGFDPKAWTPAAPRRNPPVYADTRAAWAGTWPDAPDLPVRLEAAALGGRTVYFEAVYPWTPPPRTPSTLLTPTERAAIVTLLAVLAATFAAVAIVARRNVRAGRGDRRGALRLSGFVFAAMIVSWFFGESHVATLWEVALVLMALSSALLMAGVCWLAYLAVEPFLRRGWPDVLVTWTRVVTGEIRDPQVGRDVLVGCAAGALLAAVSIVGHNPPERLGLPQHVTFADFYGVAYGLQTVVPLLVWRSAQSVMASLVCVFLLLLLRRLLRSPRAATIALVLAGSALAGAGTGQFWLAFANTAVLLGPFVVLLVRFGLLAAVVQFYVWGLLIFFPVTADLGAWYAGAGLTALLVLAALALFGFFTALAGRPAPGRLDLAGSV
jgi:serine/threonine-protein kinase